MTNHRHKTTQPVLPPEINIPGPGKILAHKNVNGMVRIKQSKKTRGIEIKGE